MPRKKIKSPARHKNSHLKHKPRGVSRRAFERVYWPYIPLIIIAAALLLPFGQRHQVSLPGRHQSVLAYATSMSVNGLLQATNAQRSTNRIGSLSLNSKLDAAAQAKAADMVARNYWSHDTPDGNPPWIFVDKQGYSYQKLGENLAAGFNDESSTVAGWMASPPHRENMLNSSYTQVGFGYVNSSSYVAGNGQPMTVVVAFYATPQTLAATSTSHSTTSNGASPTSAAPVSTIASRPAPKVSASKSSTVSKKPSPKTSQPIAKKSKPAPATTDAASTNSLVPKQNTSRLQLLLNSTPLASAATAIGLAVMFATGGLWVSKHALALRRSFAMGEAFVVRHPLLDVSLVSLSALAYLMTRTVGFIQ